MEQTTEDVCQSTPGKRRFNEVNGEDTADIRLPGSKIIKLRMETSLKSQTFNWLKWQPVAISANQMLEISDKMLEISDWFQISL
jgi:hypothetical protein